MLRVQRWDTPVTGASLPPLQLVERPAENALEGSREGHRMESEQMLTRVDF